MGHNAGRGGLGDGLKISQKGLYALQAMMTLARRHEQGAIKIREIAAESDLPEKFLELILLELKNARIVDSVRGARGGYQLRRDPAEIPLSDIIRLVDGPLAPLGDAEQLRSMIAKNAGPSRALRSVSRSARRGREDLGEHDDRRHCGPLGRKEGIQQQGRPGGGKEKIGQGLAALVKTPAGNRIRAIFTSRE